MSIYSGAGHDRTFALVVQNLFDMQQDTVANINIDRRFYTTIGMNFT